MKAVIKGDLGHAELVADRPIPQLRDGYILVKAMAVALNPIDWMKVDTFPAPGTILGGDYAGVVEAVGNGVITPFRKGDRVCGFIQGGDHTKPEHGAFAEYVLAKADMQYHIPDYMGFDEAATLGVAVMTANMGLYLKLGLRETADETMSISERKDILIYGGSTSSGAMGIQMAVRSGHTVLTTCSTQSAEFVKSLGASHVFDYKDPNCARAIRELTKDQLTSVWDTISTPESAKICAEAMSTSGGQYVSLLPVEFPRSDAQASFMDSSTSLGEYYEYGPQRLPIEVDSEAYSFAKAHVEVINRLLEERTIKPHNVEVGQNGLLGILDGLQRLRQHLVTARKLVYRVNETP